MGVLSKEEKVQMLKENAMSKDEKIELARRKRESWREWRVPAHNSPPPSRKRKLETMEPRSEVKKMHTGEIIGRGGGDPEKGKATPDPHLRGS